MLHWAGRHPIGETMRAMEKLIERGLIRFEGVSNFDVEELQGAADSLEHQRLACDQVLYHLEDRGIEVRLLPRSTQEQIAILAYSPFGHGKFPGVHNAGGRLLAEIVERHGRTPRQVALNFLTRHPNVFASRRPPIPKRIKENAGAVGWKLSAQEMDAIDRAFPAPTLVTALGAP
jgi:diketogulonate reductase-like aldo/keto reductase